MHTNTAEFESVDDLREAEEPRPVRRFRPKDTCGVVFVLFSLLFGSVFALITPPMWGFDEPTHVFRAYAVDHGRFLPEQILDGVNYGGEVPVTLAELGNYAVVDSDVLPPFPQHAVRNPQVYERFRAQPLNAPEIVIGFQNTSSYSPVAYVPSVIGLRIAEVVDGSVGFALTLMRLCDVLAYTAIVWLALWSLREHRFKWAVFVVALLPMTVYVASLITADAVTNALAILFSALFAKAALLQQRLSGVETALLFAAAFLLPLGKPTYVLLVLLLPFVPSARMAVRRWAAFAVTAAGVTGFAAWTAVSAQTSDAMHLMRPGHVVDPGLQVEHLLTNLGDVPGLMVRTFVNQENNIVTQVFGFFGPAKVAAPASAMLAVLAAGALAFGLAERVRPNRTLLGVTATIVLVSVAAIFGTLYLEWTPVGHHVIEGVQGRYFVPLAVLWFAVLLWLVPLRLELTRGHLLRGSELGIIVLVFFALFASAFKYEFIL